MRLELLRTSIVRCILWPDRAKTGNSGMHKIFLTFFAAGIGLLAVCSPVFAHHGTAAYDEKHPVTLKGTVTEFVWANPHGQIKFNVQDGNGKIVPWISETFAPGKLARDGWTRNIVKPGDEVTIVLSPIKDGSHLGLLRVMVLPDGRQLGPDAPRF
jgi:hypothetical protein